MDIYQLNDYKAVLRQILLNKKKLSSAHFTFQNLAKACRIQKTYLSKVLNVQGDLNADQLYLGCQYLGLSQEQTDYVFLLFEENRTQITARKNQLRQQISAIQKKFEKTESHLQTTKHTISNELLSEYYIDPYMQLIHIFFTIPKYHNDPQLICNQLELSKAHFSQLVDKLNRMGFLVLREGKYQACHDHIHLASDSQFIVPYKIMLRIKAIEKIAKLTKEEPYNFSVLFAANHETYQEIKTLFIQFLQKIEKLVQHATTTDVYQMNFDLLSWSK